MLSSPANDADRGSATAEFAVVVPSVVLVAALTIGAAFVGAQQLRVVDAAAVAARAAGRGDESSIVRTMLDGLSGVQASESREGDLVCVTVAATAAAPAGIIIPLSARSCAADDGG